MSEVLQAANQLVGAKLFGNFTATRRIDYGHHVSRAGRASTSCHFVGRANLQQVTNDDMFQI